GVSADAPWSDAAYKQVTYAGQPVAKFSPGKSTLPGPKQVWRCHDEGDGKVLHDHLTSADAPAPDPLAVPLLRDVMRNGKRAGELPSIESVREKVRSEMEQLPDSVRALSDPATVEVLLADELTEWTPADE
ncbi:MAG: nicotinate phosphoribosyltransferase, partial [Chloroflexi bacterium]|nr:nicotinate phosphoribosyltransferase [Chloroflexota bacterium]